MIPQTDRIATWILATACLVAGLLASPLSARCQLRGDANGDGLVNEDDAIAIMDYVFSGTPVANIASADVNRDFDVDMRDALAIGQTGVEPLLLPTFPSTDEKVVNASPLEVTGVVLVHSGFNISSLTVNGQNAVVTGSDFTAVVDLNPGQNAVHMEVFVAHAQLGSFFDDRDLNTHYLTVSGLDKRRAHPGESVLISGGGFDTTAGNTFVYFYPSELAAIQSITSSTIQVTVPLGVGAIVPGYDGITVVRKAKNGELVPTDKPAYFFPQRYHQLLNLAIDPDSTITQQECLDRGAEWTGNSCIRPVDMHPVLTVLNGLQPAHIAPPDTASSTPDPVLKEGGTATIELDTGWMWQGEYFIHESDPWADTSVPILFGFAAADLTRVIVGSGQYDVQTRMDNRNPAPLIYLQTPLGGTQTQDATILVAGNVNTSVVDIFNQTNLLTYSTLTTGTFFQQWVQLAAGPNTIEVVARDGEGREDRELVTVTRIPAIVIKYDLKDPEPKIDAGIGGDPDPGRKNASGVNLGSLDIELNGNDVPISELVFRDNETGDAFDPDDLSVTHYDVTVEYAPKIQDLNSGSNTTSVFCKDNMGNEIQAAQVTNFNANF